jgi:hypothetical protein
MATWVGVFVRKIDGKSVREIEVEADNEVDAIVRLDFYDYDETWRQYSFVEVRRKTGGIKAVLVTLKKILTQLLGTHQRKPQWHQAAEKVN